MNLFHFHFMFSNEVGILNSLENYIILNPIEIPFNCSTDLFETAHLKLSYYAH